MGIGASIFLIVVGAILTFAITADIPNIDLGVVGVILMIGGAVGLLVTLVLFGRDTRDDDGDVAYRERPPGPGTY